MLGQQKQSQRLKETQSDPEVLALQGGLELQKIPHIINNSGSKPALWDPHGESPDEPRGPQRHLPFTTVINVYK